MKACTKTQQSPAPSHLLLCLTCKYLGVSACSVTESCPDSATPLTVACKLPLSMGFSRKEWDWSGLSFLPLEDLPDPGIEPASAVSPALRQILYHGATKKAHLGVYVCVYTHMYVCVYIYRRRQWHPTPVLLSGKSHGWRSLVGCSPWGC